jgi:hypothetical protein
MIRKICNSLSEAIERHQEKVKSSFWRLVLEERLKMEKSFWKKMLDVDY